MKFDNLDDAKLYMKSFLQWSYTAVIKAPKKDKANRQMAKTLRDANDAMAYMVKHYEWRIAELEEALQKQEG